MDIKQVLVTGVICLTIMQIFHMLDHKLIIFYVINKTINKLNKVLNLEIWEKNRDSFQKEGFNKRIFFPRKKFIQMKIC